VHETRASTEENEQASTFVDMTGLQHHARRMHFPAITSLGKISSRAFGYFKDLQHRDPRQ
ncbi:hypothetical protein OAZ88_00805, partial [bacterium]|nr:hypothetical protein [bacterium]